ncbi:MAG: multicopper oxidase family protein [Rhizobiales bacterium]|nr:multicopper oxidase family protein [Hyphomicrobiales bacterium]
MSISRRKLLISAAGLGWWPFAAEAQGAEDGFQIVRARRSFAPLLGADSPETETWSFGEKGLPLLIRARQGEELKLRIVNELEFELWLHWFGVRGPSDVMTFNVPAGSFNSFDCVFTPPDAGTFWLGPMADISRLRDMGLYALLLVEEHQPVAGLEDLAIVLDDWKLSADGVIAGNFGDVEALVGEGRLGNWFTVNGQYRPRIKLNPGKYTRLRLLNAANVRSMGLLFKGSDPLLIARDGQPVKPRPLGAGSFVLAPGQRADLLVLPEADITLALDLFEDVSELAYLTHESVVTAPDIPENFALALNPLANQPNLAAARIVSLVIEGGIKGGLKSALFQGRRVDLRILLENGMGWALNGVAGPGGPPLVTAKTGETILFDIDNRTAFDQPLHVHGHVWRPVRAEREQAWGDTAVVPARQGLKLIMVADNPGVWAIQSLVAERADGGMVTAFTVE